MDRAKSTRLKACTENSRQLKSSRLLICILPEPWWRGVDGEIPFRTECSKISCSLHIVLLCIGLHVHSHLLQEVVSLMWVVQGTTTVQGRPMSRKEMWVYFVDFWSCFPLFTYFLSQWSFPLYFLFSFLWGLFVSCFLNMYNFFFESGRENIKFGELGGREDLEGIGGGDMIKIYGIKLLIKQ